VRVWAGRVRTESGPGTDAGVESQGRLEAVLMKNRGKMIVLTPDQQSYEDDAAGCERRRLLELAAASSSIVEDHSYAVCVPAASAFRRTQPDRSNMVRVQSTRFRKLRPGCVSAGCRPRNVIDRLSLVKQATDLQRGNFPRPVAEYMSRGLLSRHVESIEGVQRPPCRLEQALGRQMPNGTDNGRRQRRDVRRENFSSGRRHELLIHGGKRGVCVPPGRYFIAKPEANTRRLCLRPLMSGEISPRN